MPGLRTVAGLRYQFEACPEELGELASPPNRSDVVVLSVDHQDRTGDLGSEGAKPGCLLL